MYGKELREKILKAREKGITVAEIAKVNGVSARMIYRLTQLYRETGGVSGRKQAAHGPKPVLDEAGLRAVEMLLVEKPDITMEELREELQIPLSTSHLSRIVHTKLGYTFKKRWYMPANKIDQTCNSSGNAGWQLLPK